MKRWVANITFRTRAGSEQQAIQFDEFEELGAIVEMGPCWSTIIKIEIALLSELGDECPKTLEDEAEQRAAAGVKLQ